MKDLDIIIRHNIKGTFNNPINPDEHLRVVGYKIENDTIVLDVEINEAKHCSKCYHASGDVEHLIACVLKPAKITF